MQKDKFRYAEKCLYEYKRNLAALNILRDDLRVAQADTDVRAQNYQLTFGFGGEPKNPEEARMIKIEGIERRIQILERYTKPITQLMNDLNAPENLDGSDNEMLIQILKLMYFGRNNPTAIMCELNIAGRTFSRKRRELVFMTIDYMAV